MNSNSRNYYICQKLKAGPVIPPPDQYRHRWLAPYPHPEDATYSGPVQPQGACRNRYCPDGIAKHEKLVRGYCEPCASVRKRSGRNTSHVVDRSRIGWGSMAAIQREAIR